MAQLKVAAHGCAAQVEVAVFHTEVIAAVALVFDGEGRGLCGIQHMELRCNNLDIASRHVGVFVRALVDGARDLNDEFAAEFVGLFTEFLIRGFLEDNLGDAVAVANVNKGHAAHLASALHPSSQRHFLACIGET